MGISMKDDFNHRGFETLSVDSLTEYRAAGIHLRHIRTGAEVYKVNADDEENLFAFTFRTPPHDHTGVAHILEHTVLCGSQRFPLKDPFLVLLKGSTYTFLNAMTYPDKTVYPASSTVKTDFFNLLRVYGDAVFFPSLKNEAFEQEGHRLEFDDDNQLIRSGIVLNEMKGCYSSPESVAGDWTLRSIFPNTPYRWDSGGDPEHIPELSYEALKNFHNTYYHPSNSRIFLYGNHDLDEILTVLDAEFLSNFDYKDIDSTIALQEPWSEPRRMNAYWPCAPESSVHGKSTISLNWLWGEATDPRQAIEAHVLSYILLGHSGSPLQKALIDSHLGEDCSPISGLDSSLRQMVFSVALRGTDPEKEADMLKVVSDSLENAVTGLDKNLVEGALRSVEFRAREMSGGVPFGIRLLKRALRGWLHGRPPLESLTFDQSMKNLRSALNEDYFEKQIIHSLLKNPHRSTVVISPDPGLHERRDTSEKVHLQGILDQLSSENIQALQHSNSRLKKFQEEIDSPENLSRIPFLSPTDLPREVMKIPMKSGSGELIHWYSHDTFSNGVSYLELAFDLRGLAPELQPWMPLFGRAITDVGLPGMLHDEVARMLAMQTGGLSCSLEASPVYGRIGGDISLRLFVHLKALTSQWDEALDITASLLQSADFDNEERVDDLLMELRNDYRSAIVPSGSAFASMRATTKHSISASWEDLWYGIGQLCFLQSLVTQKDRAKIASRALKEMRNTIIQQNNLSIAVTSDFSKEGAPVLEKALGMAETLPKKNPRSAKNPELFRHETVGESLVATSSVSFSALSLPAPIVGTPEHAWAAILAHLLRTGYLWENIRMKGGAYGASASISGLEGTFTFSTYRDPFISSSLAAFRGSLEWGCTLHDEIVKMAIIGSVGRELKPLSPGERGSIAFRRKLYGIEDGVRQIHRNTQLSATAKDIRMVAEALIGHWDKRSISVIASDKDLNNACQTNPELKEARIILPT